MNPTPDANLLLERTRRREELKTEVLRLSLLEQRNSPARRKTFLVIAGVLVLLGVLAGVFLEEGSFLLGATVELALVLGLLFFVLVIYERRLRTRRLEIETLLYLELRMEACEAGDAERSD